ncbi:MAG: hypothetical protein QOJ96_2012 [Alphaproteobacteria bacterium]|nr:hypothetical protein [Alphaproteobacteria bacterium]
MPTAPIPTVIPPKKRIALFMDGTWNIVSDNTNLWRLKALCSPVSADGLAQCTYYNTGLGTRGEKFRSGMFGHGLDAAVVDGYEWLIENYNPGDEIFIFGFSRGAYIARSLSGFISKCGLLTPGAPLAVNQLYGRYRRRHTLHTLRTLHELKADKEKSIGTFTLEEEWMLKYSHPAPVKLIAVFDTVGALGIPFPNVPGLARTGRGFLNTGLKISNDYAFHALAIDEYRQAFSPTLWTQSIAKDATSPADQTGRPLSEVEQRWFVGAHANVGGGCQSDLLAQIPLRWLMSKASLHGLAFRNEVTIDGDAMKSPISDSFREFLHGAYRLLKLGRPFYRTIGTPPEDHGDKIVSTINETIDVSVFDRWRENPEYRPWNLARWAKDYGVDPASLRTSVRADAPAVAVPH